MAVPSSFYSCTFLPATAGGLKSNTSAPSVPCGDSASSLPVASTAMAPPKDAPYGRFSKAFTMNVVTPTFLTSSRYACLSSRIHLSTSGDLPSKQRAIGNNKASTGLSIIALTSSWNRSPHTRTAMRPNSVSAVSTLLPLRKGGFSTIFLTHSSTNGVSQCRPFADGTAWRAPHRLLLLRNRQPVPSRLSARP